MRTPLEANGSSCRCDSAGQHDDRIMIIMMAYEDEDEDEDDAHADHGHDDDVRLISQKHRL